MHDALRQRHPDESEGQEREFANESKEGAHDLEFGGAADVIFNLHAMWCSAAGASGRSLPGLPSGESG